MPLLRRQTGRARDTIRSQEQAACKSKVRFSSRSAAEREAKFLAGQSGIEVRPYRCRICKNFHVGQATTKERL